MARYKLIFFFTILLATFCQAAPPKKLIDTNTPSIALTLKWQQKIGLTTYRTNALFYNGFIVVGSNGRSTSESKDYLDGLYFIHAESGKIQSTAVNNTSGDKDINGVAISSEKLFWGNDNNVLFAYDWQGNPVWTVVMDSDLEGVPALEDINGDAVLDVCVATEAGSLTMIDGRNGNQLWKISADFKQVFSVSHSRAFMASPTLTDANKDGIRDVIIGSRNGYIYCYDGKNGNQLWKYRSAHPSGIFSSAYVYGSRLIVAESYHRVHELTLSGEKVNEYILSSAPSPSLFSSPVMTPENIIAIGASSKMEKNSGVWLLNQNMERQWFPIGKVSATPILAQIQGHSGTTIIAFSESGQLVFLSSSGKQLYQFSLPIGGEATPLIGHFDDDEFLDIVLLTLDGYISQYSTPFKGSVTWGSFRGNPHNTGVFNDTLYSDKPLGNDPVTRHAIEAKGYTFSDHFFLDDVYQITDTGIGQASIGMTFGRLKSILYGKAQFKDVELGIGMKAKAVIIDNDVQYYILYPSFKTLENTDPISLLVTNNTRYKTKEGIRPKQLIRDVENVYGDASLSYNDTLKNEEKIHFNKAPQSLWFSRYNTPKAGMYASTNTSKFTRDYKEGSVILFIGVKRP